jgi:hypothetical protein
VSASARASDPGPAGQHLPAAVVVDMIMATSGLCARQHLLLGSLQLDGIRQRATGSQPRRCLTDWRYSHSMVSLSR